MFTGLQYTGKHVKFVKVLAQTLEIYFTKINKQVLTVVEKHCVD